MTSQPPTPGPDKVTLAAPPGDLCISLQHYRESRPAHAAATFGEPSTSYPRVTWPDCWHHTYPRCAACWQTTSTSRSGPPPGPDYQPAPQ
jgi:hypothetical protein